MTELNFKLRVVDKVFEGPLDLLLSLIQKHKLNIMDIEISVLLEQFLNYLERMSEADLEVTSDFLEMAAKLVLIKSAELLPKEEAEKLKQELQGALIELALCKMMAEKLRKRFQGDSIFVRDPVRIDVDMSYNRSHPPEEMYLAYSMISERTRRRAEYENETAGPTVAKSYVTVVSGVLSVLKSLRLNGTVELEKLYREQPRSRRVAVFLAILELSKSGRIFISEDSRTIRLTTVADFAPPGDELPEDEPPEDDSPGDGK